MRKILIVVILVCITGIVWGQRFGLGQPLSPGSQEFEYLGTSTQTGVSSYRYKREATELFFGRKISDIVVGVRNGFITLTIYNLIPRPDDVGVPSDLINLIQENIPFPFKLMDGVYGLNIDNETISIARVQNPLTFNKDRIMIMNTIKQSILIRTK